MRNAALTEALISHGFGSDIMSQPTGSIKPATQITRTGKAMLNKLLNVFQGNAMLLHESIEEQGDALVHRFDFGKLRFQVFRRFVSHTH